MTTATSTVSGSVDSHAQLRSLYQSLLTNQAHFDEFKQLLALYGYDGVESDTETREASQIREKLNERIRSWVGPFDGLSVAQTLQWRAIVVEERFNVALSPWKESNNY